MIPKFTEEFQTRLEGLVTDLRYFHKPTGVRIAPRVYKTMLPDIAKFVVGQESNEADYSPAICWGIDGGEVGRIEKHPIDVSLIGVIAVDQSVGSSLDQILSGSADIEELAVALKGLVKDCYYDGFRLVRPVRFTFGLPGLEGDRKQPHPVYVLRYVMSFVAT